MPRGLGKLRVGGVLPLSPPTLRGTPKSPTGAVDLVLSATDRRFSIAAEPTPFAGGGQVTVTGPLRSERIPREPLTMYSSSDPVTPNPDAGGVSPTDLPVTLVVELGRVNLTLSRLADLKPGDIVELGRRSREPVEMTSGGRLVARGELVQIDTELGVRVTQVFL